MYKNRSGITLITLTITIIVMVLIMGIFISMEVNNSGVVEITKSTKILQYKFALEEKVNEDILSYDKEMRVKVEQSSDRMGTYKEYLKSIIVKEIENMEFKNVLDYNNINIKLNNSTIREDNIAIIIPLKVKAEDMTEIEINIKNTYKLFENINTGEEEEYKGITGITVN